MIRNPFRDLTRFEFGLWLTSVCAVVIAYTISGGGDVLTMIASLFGVTALIFVAKGYVIGQVLCVVFATAYGILSFHFRYYGEMITYLCMSMPMSIAAVVSWVRHPNKGSHEVKVSRLTPRQIAVVTVATVAVTIAFYFILRALGTASLIVSTISITTSFVASALTYLRSPYYAIGYAANDVVLIVLWVLASLSDISYLPMVLCFVMFLVNDLYGFYNWRNMQTRQEKATLDRG